MSIKPTSRALRREANLPRASRAAMKLYEKYSCDEVSVADICQACDLSTGSFYHLFGSKENTLFLSVATQRDKYLKAHYHMDEDAGFFAQFYDFVMVNIEYNLSVPKPLLGKTYAALVTQKCAQDLQTGRPYCDVMDYVVKWGVRIDAFAMRMNQAQMYRYVNCMIIGIAEDWCAHEDTTENELCHLFARETIRAMLKPEVIPAGFFSDLQS